MTVKVLPRNTGQVPHIRAIFYGHAGSGKTTLAYSFHKDPRTGPVLGVDLFGNPDMVLCGPDVPTIISISQPEDLNLPYHFFLAGQPAKHELRDLANIPPDVKFKTFVVDTFTDYQRLLVERITVSPKKISKENKQLSAEEIAYINNHIDEVIPVSAYQHGEEIGQVTVKSARELLHLRDINVILTLQERPDLIPISDNKSQTKIEVALYGGSRTLVPGYANIVGRLEMILKAYGTDKERYFPKIHWRSATTAGLAKAQIAAGALGNEMTNPAATKILDKIEAFYKELASN